MKPILFNTDMVKAILDGRKTVTRRLVKPRFRDGEAGFQIVTNKHTGEFIRVEIYDECESITRWLDPPYSPGDILYVRETWCECLGVYGKYLYRAYAGERDEMKEYCHKFNQWRPSIHMPKAAARLFLRVTSVRVERLQDILADPPGPNNQCVREGCKYYCDFIAVWENTVKEADRPKYGWDANPWVWVIEFERCEKQEEV